jgi:glutaminyl-peptide cyclotransferase
MSFFSGVLRGVGDLRVGLVGLLLAVGITALYGGSSPAGGWLATAFEAKEQQVPVLGIKVVKTFPHDPHAFTQGLEYYGGFLYESTGETGQSSVRKIELETGKVLQKTELSSEYFGEGLTIFRGKIYQLTWLTKVGFVYDLGTFRKLREFHFYGEGWGLAHDAANLILSDGTNTLRFLDPETFAVVRKLEVYDEKQAVTNLNELEYIENDIYANVWHANRIARIDARTGQVRAWIDCSAIAAEEQKQPEGVLNGIAYDSARRRLFVTGKDWAHLYEIRVESLTP